MLSTADTRYAVGMVDHVPVGRDLSQLFGVRKDRMYAGGRLHGSDATPFLFNTAHVMKARVCTGI